MTFTEVSAHYRSVGKSQKCTFIFCADREDFRPDKIKSTFLKRDDFDQEREIKPQIKVRVAPLRRVKNAGAKFLKKLVRRGNE